MSTPDDSVIGPPDDPAHDPLPSTAVPEPAMTIGAWVALASLGIGIIADLGLPLNDAQQRWVYLLVVFFGPVTSGILTRNKVFSPLTVDQIVQTLQWKLRAAELDASDAIAGQKTLAALYPALHAILSAPQAQQAYRPAPPVAMPQMPAQRPQEYSPPEHPGESAPMFTPGAPYPRLEQTETLSAVAQPFTPGRHRQG